MREMKKLKKASLLLVCVLMLGMFGGCGGSFDASGYIKALLDNSYMNDSTGFVDMKIGTAEEASEMYEEAIKSEVDSLHTGIEISSELEEDLYSIVKRIYASAKYNVTGSEKQSDGSYVVTVECQQLGIFGSAVEEWTATGENAETYEELYAALRDSLSNAISNATYGDTQSVTVRVELINNVYTPNESDIYKLQCALFDIE